MIDDADVTAVILGGSLVAIALSVIMLRMRHRRRKIGWVPWNGVLFTAIVLAALALAHLFGVKQR